MERYKVAFKHTGVNGKQMVCYMGVDNFAKQINKYHNCCIASWGDNIERFDTFKQAKDYLENISK